MKEDLKYFKSKLYSALKVPKSYIEYDSEIPTARGLAMEDKRFASMSEPEQKLTIEHCKIFINILETIYCKP